MSDGVSPSPKGGGAEPARPPPNPPPVYHVYEDRGLLPTLQKCVTGDQYVVVLNVHLQ